MPRGYLKHNKNISKKEARGGSSGKKNTHPKIKDPGDVCRVVEDFALDAPSTSSTNGNFSAKKAVARTDGECAICFKEAPVVCLSSKCKWHDAACGPCLHRIYVTEAQKSPKSYPLTCFHPLCDQAVHAAQLTKHGIFASPDEVRKHHEMIVLAKIQKTDGMRTVYCPKCDAPKGIRKLGDTDRTHGCINCNSRFLVSPFYATFRALDNMKSDEFGRNDGWASCPNCGILISKGDGCEHMWCIGCDHEFYWDDAQERKGRVPHARVPDGEIHLWW